MTEDEHLEQMAEDIQEMKKWVRLQGLDILQDVLEDFDPQDLAMYDAADGETTTADIAEVADVSQSTVSRRMRTWAGLGIVERKGRQWRHLAPLEVLGMEIPDLEEED